LYAQQVGLNEKEDMKVNVAEFMKNIRKIVEENV